MPDPKLSLVVPAFDEERRIAASLERIGAFLAARDYATEVVVVDDGSAAPGHEAVATAVARLPETVAGRLICHETNRGKGAAVRTGCLAAAGEYVAFIDADLATPPEEILALVAALDAGADVAVGVRNQSDGTDMRDRRSLSRRLYGRLFSLLMQAILLPGISDSQCPLKAFKRDAAQRLFRLQRIDTWSFDAELLFLARRLGLKVANIPVRWKAMPGSHLQLNLRTAAELRNLARIRIAHRGVSPKTLAADTNAAPAPEA